MNDDTTPTTRRGVLSGLAVTLAGGLTAGCTSQASRDETPVPSSGGSQVVSETTAIEPSTPSTTTTSTDSDTEPAYDFDQPATAFERLLSDRFVPVESVEVVDGRVQLTYVARSEHGHEVAAGIETVVVSFVQVYSHDWGVEALDARVMDADHSEQVMGRWRLEADWADETLHGDWTRTSLLEHTLDSYRGELEQDTDHHHEDDTSHSSADHHHEDDDSSHRDEDHDHAETATDHSHG